MRRPTWNEVKEFFDNFWTALVVKKRNFVEYMKVVFHYYSNWNFFKIDSTLMFSYLFQNPYRISKQFLIGKGEADIHVYGETPLTTLEMIAAACALSKNDAVLELGCGRGRNCFWLNCFIGCKVKGIEHIPEFVEKAIRIKMRFQLSGVQFQLGDIREADYSGFTVIYLYGTCLEDEFISLLIEKFRKMPSGTKIITISYPLTDYTSEPIFEVMKRFPASFTWGEADVYLQVKK